MDEAAVSALFVQMIREGILAEDTVLAAAEECDAVGASMPAHRLRCLIVAAATTPEVELSKQRKRANLRSIDGGNGS